MPIGLELDVLGVSIVVVVMIVVVCDMVLCLHTSMCAVLNELSLIGYVIRLFCVGSTVLFILCLTNVGVEFDWSKAAWYMVAVGSMLVQHLIHQHLVD